MTLTLELTPETERRLAEEAARRGQSPTDIALHLLEEGLRPPPQSEQGAPSETDGVSESGQTWGARLMAKLDAEGAVPIFLDRPEDSPELARKFREEAQRRDRQPCS